MALGATVNPSLGVEGDAAACQVVLLYLRDVTVNIGDDQVGN